MPASKLSRSLRWVVLVGSIAVFHACGGELDVTGPNGEKVADKVPTSLDLGPDTTFVKSGATAQLTTVAKNKGEEELVGLEITFASSDSNIAAVSQAGVVTGRRAGKATVTASIKELTATSLVTVTAGAPVALAKAVDAPANPVVGSSSNISVRVTDSVGNLVPDVAVNFAVTAGGGSVAAETATTNASGVANTSFTVGNTAGVNTATATVAGVGATLTYTATSVPGPSASLAKVTSDPTNVVAGQKYGEIKAKVTDAFGNPKQGVTVGFSVSAGGGSVSPTGAITNAAGEAATQFTTGKIVGANTALAAVSGVTTPASFTTTTIAGPAAKVKTSVPIAIVAVGGTAAVTAAVADSNNNPTTGTLTYTSRAPGVAEISSEGVITGVSAGQTFIVASGPLGVDSLIAVVRGLDTPVLLPDVSAFSYAVNTDVVVTIVMDLTGSTEKLGAATLKLEWDPAVAGYRSNAAIAGGPTPTVNASQTGSGSLSFGIANVAGLSGRIQLLKVTLRAVSTAGKTGTIRLIASEAVAAGTFVNLLTKTVPVTVPIITR